MRPSTAGSCVTSSAAEVQSAPNRRRTLVIVGWVAALVVVGFTAWMLRGHWHAARSALLGVRPAWGPLLASGSVVLVAYAILVWTWRECVRDAGDTVRYGAAARIWFVSNLARYVPGALWQIGALAMMARQHGGSASAAASSAVVLTVINTLCGAAIALVLGAGKATGVDIPWLAIAASVLGLAALRWVAPPIMRRLAAWRSFQVPAVGTRMLAASVVGSTLAWLLYGVGFYFLVHATFPDVGLGLVAAIAIYTTSYLAGFLAFAPPAGIGVSESAMIYLLSVNGIADPAVAAAIAAITRLWRSVLEVAPGLVLLLVQPSRGSRTP